eukprot:scaffold130812_cov72-Phaeocystis_antarctica.AAC.1
MDHAFAELRDGVVARQREERQRTDCRAVLAASDRRGTPRLAADGHRALPWAHLARGAGLRQV